MFERPHRVEQVEVHARREQRVEGLEVGRVRVVVAAGDVEPEAEARFERQVAEVVADGVRGAPRLDVARSEPAELPVVFEVVLPRHRPPPEPHAERVPQFVAWPLDVDGVLVLEAEVVQIDVALGQQGQGRTAYTPQKERAGSGLSSKASGLLRTGLDHQPSTSQSPVLQQEPRGVERQAQVHAVAHVDEAARAVLELLTPQPGGERVLLGCEGQDKIREGLMNVEDVLVDVGAWSADAPVLQAGDDLPEEAEVRAEVEVAVGHIPLEQIGVVADRVGGPGPRTRVVDELEALRAPRRRATGTSPRGPTAGCT